MSINAWKMTKKEALEILNEIRHMPSTFFRSYNDWHSCPKCNHEFQDFFPEEDYPTDIDLVYEFIEEKIKEE